MTAKPLKSVVGEMNQLSCQKQTTSVNCPIHVNSLLKVCTAKKSGRTFFKCNVKSCPVFCFQDELADYQNSVNTNLLPMYGNYSPLCQCEKPATLKVKGFTSCVESMNKDAFFSNGVMRCYQMRSFS